MNSSVGLVHLKTIYNLCPQWAHKTTKDNRRHFNNHCIDFSNPSSTIIAPLSIFLSRIHLPSSQLSILYLISIWILQLLELFVFLTYSCLYGFSSLYLLQYSFIDHMHHLHQQYSIYNSCVYLLNSCSFADYTHKEK